MIALFAATAAIAAGPQALAPAHASAMVSQGDDPCAPLAGVDWWAWHDCETNGGGGGGGGGSTAGEDGGSADGGSGSGTASDNSGYYDESGDDCADYGDCWPEPDDEDMKNLSADSGYADPGLAQNDCWSTLGRLHWWTDEAEDLMDRIQRSENVPEVGIRSLRHSRRMLRALRAHWLNSNCDTILTGGD